MELVVVVPLLGELRAQFLNFERLWVFGFKHFTTNRFSVIEGNIFPLYH